MLINTDFLLNQIYPVGSLYITTNSANPSTFLGGTWEKITSDAYLKIVSSNAGSLGGTSSQHKIPVSSMPNHSHQVRYTGGSANGIYGGMPGTSVNATPRYNDLLVAYEGGGNAYYPYYYGIYVFRRTA
ncbi:MAG: hypothetical protein J6J23_06335 [Clostridia bacterium]|nr:hypothetical protein [Clostridia bacterium]